MSNTMNAAFVTGLKKLEIKNISIPKIEPGTVLLKINSCSVCGSDVRIFDTGNSRVTYPAIIGHEVSGEVVEVGDGVTRLKLGDKIALGADVPCGNCKWCLTGDCNCCDKNYALGYQFFGGYAQYCLLHPLIVKYGALAQIPNNFSMEEAALAEPLACCINGMQRVQFSAGKSVLVIGAGPIGILLAQLARVFGSPQIILADISEERLRYSNIANPDHIINSSKADLVDTVKNLTNGIGVDVVFTACAVGAVHEVSFNVVAKRGWINFFGGLPVSAGPISILSNQIHYKEICVTGSHGSTPSQFDMAMKLISSGRIKVSSLITHRFKLSELENAFSAVRDRKGLKVVVKP
jgi:L-iditol 2-dehydrogenase